MCLTAGFLGSDQTWVVLRGFKHVSRLLVLTRNSTKYNEHRSSTREQPKNSVKYDLYQVCWQGNRCKLYLWKPQIVRVREYSRLLSLFWPRWTAFVTIHKNNRHHRSLLTGVRFNSWNRHFHPGKRWNFPPPKLRPQGCGCNAIRGTNLQFNYDHPNQFSFLPDLACESHSEGSKEMGKVCQGVEQMDGRVLVPR